MVGETRALIVGVVALLASFSTTADELRVHAACRDGAPHGAYELRAPSGEIRIAGAFNRGQRTGSFIFWTSNGIRVAHIPYDEGRLSGTVSLWFEQTIAGRDAQPKLQAAFTAGHRNGVSRSWYPDGQPRAIYRYEMDALVVARAWSRAGTPLPESEARELAARDRDEDQKYYASLDAMVLANLPACDEPAPGGTRARSDVDRSG
jgi:hypothetical protein